jgi:hypothetical protein
VRQHGFGGARLCKRPEHEAVRENSAFSSRAHTSGGSVVFRKRLSLICVLFAVLSFFTLASASTPAANGGLVRTLAIGTTVQLARYNFLQSVRNPTCISVVSRLDSPGGDGSIRGTTTPRPTFVIDKAASYTAQLVVNNGANGSPSTVVISTVNPPRW